MLRLLRRSGMPSLSRYFTATIKQEGLHTSIPRYSKSNQDASLSLWAFAIISNRTSDKDVPCQLPSSVLLADTLISRGPAPPVGFFFVLKLVDPEIE